MRRTSGAAAVAWLLLATPTVAGSPFDPPSPLEVRVLGDQRWLSRSRAGLRVTVRDARADRPIEADLTIAIARRGARARGEPHRLWQGRTGALGTADLSLRPPDLPHGEYVLSVAVAAPLGTDLVERPITIADGADALLVTDRARYQPGDTVHARCLVLRRPARTPVALAEVPVEVVDEPGNRIHRQTLRTSSFGRFELDLPLAAEVRPGVYVLRALLPDGPLERRFAVAAAPEPRARVTIATERSYYLAGESVTGSVRAVDSATGPIAGARVRVGWAAASGEPEDEAASGLTAADGSLAFALPLPAARVGGPHDPAHPRPRLAAVVEDAAGRRGLGQAIVPAASEAIQIRILPEGGGLVAGLENTVFVLLAYPDGRPVAWARLEASVGGAISEHAADGLGIVELHLVPEAVPLTVEVRARDEQGLQAEARADLAGRGDRDEGLVLSLDRALARPRDRVQATVLSTRPGGVVYLDLVADQQTVASKAVALERGRAVAALALPAEGAGTLEVRAYRLTSRDELVSDSRRLWVAPASELRVEVEPAAAGYRAGDVARLAFTVRDAHGAPAVAALAVAAGDAGTAALEPGAERAYFGLDPALAASLTSVAGWDLRDLALNRPVPLPGPLTEAALEENRARAARVLFAAAPAGTGFTLRANTYAERLERSKARWGEALAKDAAAIQAALKRYYDKGERRPLPEREPLVSLLNRRLLVARQAMDPWGHRYRARVDGAWIIALDSPGPDGVFGGLDDLSWSGWRRPENAGATPAAETAPAAAAAAAAERAPLAVESPSPAPFVLWQPALVTGEDGRAVLDVELPRALEEVQLSVGASGRDGELGGASVLLDATAGLILGVELPATLTRGDEVTAAVALTNRASAPRAARIELRAAGALRLRDPRGARDRLLQPGEAAIERFRVEASGTGRGELTLTATGEGAPEVLARSLQVEPDGRVVAEALSDRLERTGAGTITLPPRATDAGSLARFYPDPLADLAGARAALAGLRAAGFGPAYAGAGLDRLAAVAARGRPGPPVPERTAGDWSSLAMDYQRLLTFEVAGGGFSWTGDAPADPVLTAAGLIELEELRQVFPVDPALVARLAHWLAAQQRPDGWFEAGLGGFAAGAPDAWTDGLRTTAWAARALARPGYSGPELGRALDVLAASVADLPDPLALALAVDALAAGARGDVADAAAALLAGQQRQEGGAGWWHVAEAGPGAGAAADVAATALATGALLRSGREPAAASAGLLYLARVRDARGIWPTPEATVWAEQALVAGAGAPTEATVSVAVNGVEAGRFTLVAGGGGDGGTPSVAIGALLRRGENRVETRFEGQGTLLYQVVRRSLVPWTEPAAAPLAPARIALAVAYDRAEAAVDEPVHARVTVATLGPDPARRVVLEIGLPPGFELEREPIAALAATGAIRGHAVAGRHLVVSIERIEPAAPFVLDATLRARQPLRVKTPPSRAYAYDDPDGAAEAPPVTLTVR